MCISWQSFLGCSFFFDQAAFTWRVSGLCHLEFDQNLYLGYVCSGFVFTSLLKLSIQCCYFTRGLHPQ